MNDFQLPPERDLPEEDTMLNRILDDAPARRPWLLPAAAALTLIAAGSAGAVWLNGAGNDNSPAPAVPATTSAAPSVSATTEPSPTQSQTSKAPEASKAPGSTTSATTGTASPSGTKASTKPTTQQPSTSSTPGLGRTEQTMGEGTLKLGYVDVTLKPKGSANAVQTIHVKVCVKHLPPGYEAGLPVSERVWTHDALPSKTVFPRLATGNFGSATLQPGQCHEGDIKFDIAKAEGQTFDAASFRYDTSFGDHAVWSFD